MAVKVYEAHVENQQIVPVPVGKTWKILAVVMIPHISQVPIVLGDHLHAAIHYHPSAFGNGVGLQLFHTLLNWTAPEPLHPSTKIVASIGSQNLISREDESLAPGWYLFNSRLPDIAISAGNVRLSLRVNGSFDNRPFLNSGFLIEETGG